MSDRIVAALLRKQDSLGENRWQVKASNGKIISVSSEGYKDPRDRDRSIEITLDAIIGSLTPFERADAIRRILDDAEKKELLQQLLAEIDERELPKMGYVKLASDDEIDDILGEDGDGETEGDAPNL